MSTLPILLVALFCYFFVLDLSTRHYGRLIENQSTASEKHLADFYSYQADNLMFASQLAPYQNLLLAAQQQSGEPEAYEAALATATDIQLMAKNTNSYLDQSYLLNNDGIVLSATQEETVGQSLSQHPAFMAATFTSREASAVVEEAGVKKIMLARAVTDGQGRQLGVMMRLINLDFVSRYIDNLEIGEAGYLYILDGKGDTLSHYYDDRVSLSPAPGSELRSLDGLTESIRQGAIRQRPTGSFDYTLRGERIRASYQYDPISGWTVVAAMPYSEIYGSARLINTYIVIIALSVVVLSLGVGLWAIRGVTRPLAYFNEKIKDIAAGNLQSPCTYTGRDEFAELCRSTNQMTQSLYQSQQALASAALTDPLTGLPNRKAMYNTLDALFSGQKRQAALLLDLDGFKEVNDNLGHDYGDDVLLSVAGVLHRAQGETVYPSRLGGDEFFVFLSHYHTEAEVMDLAVRILRGIQAITSAKGQPIAISASIGIAFAEEADKNKSRLMKKADLAMYAIKKSGKSDCQVFDNRNGKVELYMGE